MGENATVLGEKEASYATGALQTSRKITGQTETFGNMGVQIDAGGQDLGKTTLIRKAGEGTAVAVPFQSSINRTWEIRTEKPANQPVTLKLQWLVADNNSRDLVKAQVWESGDGLLWSGIKPTQNLTALETSLKTKNLHHFTISGGDLKGTIQYSRTVFEESGLNDGSIANVLKLKLEGDYEFNGKAGEDLARDKKLEISNLPAGLVLEAIFINEKEIEIRLKGKALSHETKDHILNLGVKFLPNAFKGGNAQYIANADRQDLQITFRDQSLNETLLIYPVPSPNIVYVNLELAALAEVRMSLYDNYILLLKSEEKALTLLYKTQFDISHLPTGVYILKVETAQNVFIRKIVKE